MESFNQNYLQVVWKMTSMEIKKLKLEKEPRQKKTPTQSRKS